MKLKLFACLVVGALVSVTPAVADPSFEPFLAVDFNGYVNSDGLQLPGPTEAGFQAWDIEDSLFAPWTNSTNAAGISQVFLDHVSFSTSPASAALPPAQAPSRVSGVNSGVLTISPVIVEDTGLYTVSYDDGTKAPVVLSHFLTVGNEVPVSGVVGIAALGLGITVLVARKLRRK